MSSTDRSTGATVQRAPASLPRRGRHGPGHARWGDRIVIASSLDNGGAFDRAIAHFPVRYEDQNERGYEAFVGAVNTGRLALTDL